jgi:hypothetical protein
VLPYDVDKKMGRALASMADWQLGTVPPGNCIVADLWGERGEFLGNYVISYSRSGIAHVIFVTVTVHRFIHNFGVCFIRSKSIVITLIHVYARVYSL